MENKDLIKLILDTANSLDKVGMYKTANKLTIIAMDVEDSFGEDYANRKKVYFDPSAEEPEGGRKISDKQRRELDLFLRSKKFSDEEEELYNIRLEDDTRSLIYNPDPKRIKDYRATLEELMDKVRLMEEELDKDFIP